MNYTDTFSTSRPKPPGSNPQGAVDPELKSFIESESAKAQLQNQVHKMNSMCWDICVGKPREKMDGSTEKCLCNCVERFIDTAKVIEQRLQQRISHSSGGMM